MIYTNSVQYTNTNLSIIDYKRQIQYTNKSIIPLQEPVADHKLIKKRIPGFQGVKNNFCWTDDDSPKLSSLISKYWRLKILGAPFRVT